MMTKPSSPRLILLEFNELAPALMQQFIDEGKLPNFARMYARSEVFTTDAHEEYPYLEPWIQWVTVHTGLAREAHGIQRLADGANLQVKRIWDYVSDAGRAVWVCGSMNAHYQRPIEGHVLPDPWSARVAPHPAELAPYYEFVRQNVQEHSNREAKFGARAYLAFLWFMATHGLSLATVTAIVKQLAGERLGRAPHWKRATLLDLLQWDVFERCYRRRRPHLATFFLNSTAHLQHQFWRDLTPAAFSLATAEGDGPQKLPPQARKGAGAILHGYQQMDRLVGRAQALCDDHTSLVLCSALSQQACADFDTAGGKLTYRPRSFDKLLAALGVTAPCRSEATMAEQFRLQFTSDADALAAAETIKAPLWQGQRVFNAKPNGSLLYCGCRLHGQMPQGAEIEIPGAKALPFFELLYQIDALKSGKHHPDGIFWVQCPGGRHSVHAKRVPLERVFPTLLELLGVAAPAEISSPSLLSNRLGADTATCEPALGTLK